MDQVQIAVLVGQAVAQIKAGDLLVIPALEEIGLAPPVINPVEAGAMLHPKSSF